MKIDAKDPDAYVKALPPEKRVHIERLRALVRRAVPAAVEDIQWGMIAYSLDGIPMAAIAAQKNYLSLYLTAMYKQPALIKKYGSAFSDLKKGKSCINFMKADELPLDVIESLLREASLSGGHKKTPKRRGAAK